MSSISRKEALEGMGRLRDYLSVLLEFFESHPDDKLYGHAGNVRLEMQSLEEYFVAERASSLK